MRTLVSGINPVGDDAANTKRIADAVFNFMTRHQIPTQVVVLSRITTQMEALRRGAPLSMIFQSIAGTQDANDDFGVSRELLEAAYDLVAQYGQCQGGTTPRSPWTIRMWNSRPQRSPLHNERTLAFLGGQCVGPRCRLHRRGSGTTRGASDVQRADAVYVEG